MPCDEWPLWRDGELFRSTWDKWHFQKIISSEQKSSLFWQDMGKFFFDRMSRSSFLCGTRDFGQNSSLQSCPWRMTWRVGCITTVPEPLATRMSFFGCPRGGAPAGQGLSFEPKEWPLFPSVNIPSLHLKVRQRWESMTGGAKNLPIGRLQYTVNMKLLIRVEECVVEKFEDLVKMLSWRCWQITWQITWCVSSSMLSAIALSGNHFCFYVTLVAFL